MAGGILALLDDVAVLAKTAMASLDDVAAGAAKASAKSAGERSVTPDMIVMISDTEAVLDAGLGVIDHTEDDYLEGDGHNEEHHAEDGHDHVYEEYLDEVHLSDTERCS